MLSRVIGKGLRHVGDPSLFRIGYPSTWGSLSNLARYFRPGGIIDIGAHKGHWALKASKIFTGVPIHMVEAQEALRADLEAAGFPYTLCLLGAEQAAAVPFHVDPVWPTGASVLEEVTAFDRDELALPMRRLDDLQVGLSGPLLLKLDVQGYELQVLAGAQETLKNVEVIMAEVALLEYNKGAPLISEVIAYLSERGFVPYDIGDMMRRHEDRALFQCDMIFVKKDSQIRIKRKFYEHEISDVVE
ncbi:FkbM family methyltransferase [Sphingomonas glaciei]|uniref:FkbM family methyltransferase n=1 Tax=Sphingomonas glaciei TaxID=2938948 RepID=A0ABY5MSE4_9SPHN|nr:FkbM family methyltransferase [Sphingomonas glaciei]UUR06967.1 FkbM family methyltransferase [Sphingomonas glaciei]